MFTVASCKKQDDWLNAKSKISDVTPKTLQDFQAILDNTNVMNSNGSIMGLIGSDNIYIPDANLDGTDQTSKNAYLWAKDIYQGATATDWYFSYTVVEYCNIVLDGLEKLTNTSPLNSYNNIRGSALFYRAYAFYQLCQLYCKPYVQSTASVDLGIPIRLSSDVNIKSVRASIQESYTQIINDLKTSIALLPQLPLYKTRPSSVAANALLAKVYLSMSDFNNAYTYADVALKSYGTLLNYNTLAIGKTNPFPTFAKGHPEIIFFASAQGFNSIIGLPRAKARIAPDLYESYETGDLRKMAFFIADGSTGLYSFKASYTAQAYDFCGLATDELYLIRAECLTRKGSISAALADLDLLLKNRYTPSTFSAIVTSDQAILLNRVILERRKEMPYTGNIRWDDLKRLNLEIQFTKSLARTYHGTLYTLPANDARYVLPLPNDEIQLNDLQQNIR